MLATKALFPYQSFQGEEPEDDVSSEEEEDVAKSMFCMAGGADPDVLEEHRESDALRDISKKVTRLDADVVAHLPPHYRYVVESFAAVAVENALEFETATNHELILDEFKDAKRTAEDPDGVHKLGKFWKAGTYGEITCPAVDIIAGHCVCSLGAGQRVEDIVWYDLGSGVGKAVLQFALQFRIKHAVGIELAASRHAIAAAACEWLLARKAPFISVKPPSFVCGSFTDKIYQDATHVFANSLLFGAELERHVARILVGCPALFQVVSTTRLPLPPHLFRLRKERLQLPVSWQEQPQQAFVFERRPVPPPSFSTTAASARKVANLALHEASFSYAQNATLLQEWRTAV